MHSFDFRAISFDRHGYLAEETVGFIKQLAYCRALWGLSLQRRFADGMV